jgi:hypothetical protein
MLTADEALRRIKAAVARGQYFIHPHAQTRMRQRNATLYDVKHAIGHARSIQPYRRDAGPAGTSSWRVMGPDLDGDELTMGLDLTTNAMGDHVLVLTVF